MKRIIVNMLSNADKVDGQGVGSAYLEQVKLIAEGASDIIDVRINSWKQADIVHHHTIILRNYIRMKVAKGANVAYVHFLPHTLEGSIRLPKPIFWILKKYVISFYKGADCLIVVNPIFTNDLMQYGISEDKIKYIPNYVSKEDFNRIEDDARLKLRESYGFTKEDFIVLGVGQVQSRKGVLDFIDVAKKNPDMQFVWAGGFSFGMITDGYEELKKVVETPPNNVKFIGIVERTKMNDVYNLADVLFMPSYNELFPMSILEAINSQMPLLLRDLELYEGILFHKYITGTTNEEFSKQLHKLRDDQSFYSQYSDMSRELSEYYSKENVLEIWREFYQEFYQFAEDRKRLKGLK